jgi:Flp pilus assembly protein TadD
MAMNLGRIDEGTALSRRALEQDPLNASSYHNLGLALDRSGRRAEAEAAYRKALELTPQRAVSRAILALNLLAQGRGAEALAEVLREPEEWARLLALAIIQFAAGRPAESEAALQELIAKHSAESAYQVAMVYAARGEGDLAFAWLERAYVQRDPGLAEMKPDACFRSLHADRAVGSVPAQDGIPGIRRKPVAARRRPCSLLHDRFAMTAVSDSRVRQLVADCRGSADSIERPLKKIQQSSTPEGPR